MTSDAPLKILVVDDNPATRYTTSRILRAAGYAVTEAASGQEAIQRAEEGPNAVVLDVNLPDIDGFEVCRILRTRESVARIPIIHLSATFVGDIDKVHGLEAGADGYLTHPVEPPVLIATVRAFLRARQAEEAMRRSEEKFRAIFDQASHGIALLSEDLIYIEVNPAFCRMLGRSREELIGKQNSVFVPKDYEALLPVIANDLRTAGLWRGFLPLIKSDSHWADLEWSLSHHSLPSVRLAMVTDIGERRRLEAEREHLLASERAARTEAERANRLKDEFLATLSHELRTPLTAIVGWTQILQQVAVTPEDLREAIEAITRNANAQSKLVADLLDVSRITSGKMHLDVQTVEAAALVNSSLEAVLPAAEAKRITIVRQIDGKAGAFAVDPSRLQQVIWNLANNAVKFTPPGGTIHVSLRRLQTEMEIVIADTGQGIPAQFLPHLFERFRQENATTRRNHGGLGLGLAIVKHLLEMHGGSVTAESPGAGKGATFIVRLPISQPQADVASDPAASGSIAQSASSAPPVVSVLRGVRILVVDDDADSRTIISRMLRDYDAEVFQASNATDALTAIPSFHPHLLVSDIGMPSVDGHDFMRAVRAIGFSGDDLPAIAVTAFVRPEERLRTKQAGFQAHIAKPVDANLLVNTAANLTTKVKS